MYLIGSALYCSCWSSFAGRLDAQPCMSSPVMTRDNRASRAYRERTAVHTWTQCRDPIMAWRSQCKQLNIVAVNCCCEIPPPVISALQPSLTRWHQRERMRGSVTQWQCSARSDAFHAVDLKYEQNCLHHVAKQGLALSFLRALPPLTQLGTHHMPTTTDR